MTQRRPAAWLRTLPAITPPHLLRLRARPICQTTTPRPSSATASREGACIMARPPPQSTLLSRRTRNGGPSKLRAFSRLATAQSPGPGRRTCHVGGLRNRRRVRPNGSQWIRHRVHRRLQEAVGDLAGLPVNEYLSTHCASSRHLMSRLLARTVPAMSKERHG
jgi:hypothetical protein